MSKPTSKLENMSLTKCASLKMTLQNDLDQAMLVTT